MPVLENALDVGGDYAFRVGGEADAWRRATGDPLVDPEKLDLLVAEDREVTAMKGAHREPGFAWKYPVTLYPS